MGTESERWSYLSPAHSGWLWVQGPRAGLRHMVANMVARREDIEDPVQKVLCALEEMTEIEEMIKMDIGLLVTEAFIRGASWEKIARRLKRSKQAIHQRYLPLVHSTDTHQRLQQDLKQAEMRARYIAFHRREDEGALSESIDLLRRIGYRSHSPA